MASFLSDVSGNGVRAILSDGEDVFVGAGVTVATTGDTAIICKGGASSGHEANIAGSLHGSYSGIVLGNSWYDHDQTLQIWKGGEVRGSTMYGASLQGSHITVNNAGLIYGAAEGLLLVAGSGAASSITNSGTIRGGAVGIETNNGGGQALTITNSGTIKASDYSFLESGDGGSDKLINAGVMKGSVSLSNGGDIYDGRKGHVQGTVLGNGGDDKLSGGSENNKLDGGSGHDTLFGGKGNDWFLFGAALGDKTNVDTVLDFANKSGNDDRVYLSVFEFAGMASGTLSGDAFHLGKHAADKQDRIVYDQKHGDLYFDRDGSGSKYEVVKFAHFDNHATLSHADFFVADF